MTTWDLMLPRLVVGFNQEEKEKPVSNYLPHLIISSQRRSSARVPLPHVTVRCRPWLVHWRKLLPSVAYAFSCGACDSYTLLLQSRVQSSWISHGTVAGVCPREADRLLLVEKHSAGVMSAFTAGGRQAAVSSHWLKKKKTENTGQMLAVPTLPATKFYTICIVGIFVFCSEIGQFCWWSIAFIRIANEIFNLRWIHYSNWK